MRNAGTHFPDSGGSYLPRSTWVGALGLACLGLLLQVVVPDGLLTQFQGWLTSATLLLGAVAFVRRARRPGEPRHAWHWFVLAILVNVLSAALSPLVVASAYLTYLIAISYLCFMVVGILSCFEEGILWAGGIRRILEGLIFALAVITLAWKAVLGSSLLHPDPGWVRLLLSFVFQAIILGVVVFEVQVDLNRLKGPLGWLGLYWVLSLVDNVFTIQAQIQGVYSSRHLSAMLGPLEPLLLLLAAQAPWTRDALRREEGRGQNPWGGFLAYFPFGVALAWMLVSLRPGVPPDPVIMLLVGAMATLMLVRQLIALRDQASFHRILQARLDERTTALEESQEAILRTQRLNLVATIGAGMAHDLNNLLGVVCTLAEQGGSKEELVRTAHRAAALARKSMAHAGDPGATRELFDLGESLEHLNPILQRLAGRGITLTMVRDHSECWLEADPLQVEQALVNLVTNARDAMQGEGQIQISLQAEGSWSCIEVEDSGPGMSPEILDRIFDPFFTTKVKGSGTGLGLPSVKAFCDAQGGTVSVQSEVGGGTRFTIRLPRISDL